MWLRDFALSSATAENRDRFDRGCSDEEIFGYESHDYGDRDTFDSNETTRRDVESIGNQIEKTRGSLGSEEISLIQHGAQQNSKQQQGLDDSGPQASTEKWSAIAQDQEKSFAGLQSALSQVLAASTLVVSVETLSSAQQSPEPLDSEQPLSSEDLEAAGHGQNLQWHRRASPGSKPRR